jgi:hypothetical protein
VIATQVTELAGDLPRYQFTMREKIKSLRGTAATALHVARRKRGCNEADRGCTKKG